MAMGGCPGIIVISQTFAIGESCIEMRSVEMNLIILVGESAVKDLTEMIIPLVFVSATEKMASRMVDVEILIIVSIEKLVVIVLYSSILATEGMTMALANGLERNLKFWG